MSENTDAEEQINCLQKGMVTLHETKLLGIDLRCNGLHDRISSRNVHTGKAREGLH